MLARQGKLNRLITTLFFGRGQGRSARSLVWDPRRGLPAGPAV